MYVERKKRPDLYLDSKRSKKRFAVEKVKYGFLTIFKFARRITQHKLDFDNSSRTK
jgi:hypothetical protein